MIGARHWGHLGILWHPRRGASIWLVGLLVLAGCATTSSTTKPQTLIGGTMQGEGLGGDLIGPPTKVGVAAIITCNGFTTSAASTGDYSLRLPAASEYQCSAAADSYNPQTVTLSGFAGHAITLNFGVGQQSGCVVQRQASAMECGLLTLKTGTVVGRVSYNGGRPVPSATVTCAAAAEVSVPQIHYFGN